MSGKVLAGVVLVASLTVGTMAAAASSGIDGAATARVGAARVGPPPPPPEPFSPEEAAGRAVADLLNAERARRGLPALAWHPQVYSAAAAHSADMAASRTMSHTGSDGTNAGARLERAGFAWGAWAENIGAGYADAGAMYQGWFGSPPHLANMLGDYRYVGVAAAEGGGALWWTMVVAS